MCLKRKTFKIGLLDTKYSQNSAFLPVDRWTGQDWVADPKEPTWIPLHWIPWPSTIYWMSLQVRPIRCRAFFGLILLRPKCRKAMFCRRRGLPFSLQECCRLKVKLPISGSYNTWASPCSSLCHWIALNIVCRRLTTVVVPATTGRCSSTEKGSTKVVPTMQPIIHANIIVFSI